MSGASCAVGQLADGDADAVGAEGVGVRAQDRGGIGAADGLDERAVFGKEGICLGADLARRLARLDKQRAL